MLARKKNIHWTKINELQARVPPSLYSCIPKDEGFLFLLDRVEVITSQQT